MDLSPFYFEFLKNLPRWLAVCVLFAVFAAAFLFLVIVFGSQNAGGS